MSVHAYVHPCIHAYIHPYIHTYIHRPLLRWRTVARAAQVALLAWAGAADGAAARRAVACIAFGQAVRRPRGVCRHRRPRTAALHAALRCADELRRSAAAAAPHRHCAAACLRGLVPAQPPPLADALVFRRALSRPARSRCAGADRVRQGAPPPLPRAARAPLAGEVKARACACAVTPSRMEGAAQYRPRPEPHAQRLGRSVWRECRACVQVGAVGPGRRASLARGRTGWVPCGSAHDPQEAVEVARARHMLTVVPHDGGAPQAPAPPPTPPFRPHATRAPARPAHAQQRVLARVRVRARRASAVAQRAVRGLLAPRDKGTHGVLTGYSRGTAPPLSRTCLSTAGGRPFRVPVARAEPGHAAHALVAGTAAHARVAW